MDLLPQDASPHLVYRQAKKILKNTSRARNADWYKEASALPLQWHIWVGNQTVSSAIYNKTSNEWFDGPELPPIAFDFDEDKNPIGLDDESRNGLHDLVRRILATKEFGLKAKSLGITFHLSDSIRVRDISPDFAEETDFENVNELLISAPEIALGDESISPSEGHWRCLPLFGMGEGDKRSIAVQISGQYKFLVEELREYGELRNLPVIANVHAAPLEAMTQIPEIFPTSDTTNTICLLQYEGFTYMFAVGSKKELLLVRPLIHRTGTHLSQSEVADVVRTTSALLNIKDPNVLYASMTGMPDAQLQELLGAFREANPGSRTSTCDIRSLEQLQNVPGKRIEFHATVQSRNSDNTEGSLFADLRKKWAFQDFYGLSREARALMPSRADLQLLKFSGILQKVALVGVLAFAGWSATDFFTKMTSEAWKLDSVEASTMQQSVTKLKTERKEWEHWDSLLTKRSEGWLALETLLSIFPESGGVILNQASYSVSSLMDRKDKSIGLSRVWQVSGYANPEVASELPTLGSRNRVTQIFSKIAEENQAPYLNVDSETRSLEVSLAQKQGTMPSSIEFPTRVARHFRNAFDLRIEQKIEAADDLAINTKALK
ncbi:MAG: hypothetical protein P1U68_04815 [Verrucomicrobiales bacterium]|nr:hypothetical protein [Verrucomicrobiales bacterium]